jgi:hypothetical protein
MDGMKSAVTALVLALLAGQASAQDGALVNMWPKAGGWVTTLTTLPKGGTVCSSSTGPQKTGTGQEEASFGFDIDERETHFHLRLRGAGPMDPSSLQMEVSGSVLVLMPVIQRLDKDGVQDIVADIVGDRFVLLVEPRLVGKAPITIRAGDRTYVLPHENFVRTIDNLSACAAEARQPNALPLR